jgi:alpha-L-rhamnosidase
MSSYAQMLHKADDAARFRKLAERLAAAFNAKYLKTSLAQYDNGAPTTSVLPLAFGIVPPPSRQPVFEKLVSKLLGENQGHIGTGLVGGQWLMRVLSDNGRADIAYTLAGQKTYPSWGYMLANNATTIWELWNGNTADPGMNSHNHVMLIGDLGIWMHEDLAGIQPDPRRPGFQHIVMHPHLVGDLKSAEAVHQSPYGTIRSAWRRTDSAVQWEVRVPVGATATAYVPATDPRQVTESGQPAAQAEGVKFVRGEPGAAVYELGSGEYRFASTMAK